MHSHENSLRQMVSETIWNSDTIEKYAKDQTEDG